MNKAFIDKLNTISLTSKSNINSKELKLLEGEKLLDFQIFELGHQEEGFQYTLVTYSKLNLSKEISIFIGIEFFLKAIIRDVVKSDEFDLYYQYGGLLGPDYHEEQITFYLWAPTQKEVFLCIYKDGKERKYKCNYKQGLWIKTLKGDYDGIQYRYCVRYTEDFYYLLDPYGKSIDILQEYNYVINDNKLVSFKNDTPKLDNKLDSIIYEINIRDITSSKTSMVTKQKQFIGMLEETLDTSLDYIKNLGVTHLQMMPINTFAGVNESTKLDYNWGYNPISYFSISNYYTNQYDDPYAAINELRMVIDRISEFNMAVCLDVVFNHVYHAPSNALELSVPGYYFRKNSRGFSNDSGCGNDLASEKLMTRKLIIDCINYFKKIFKIQGFRFDLMGLLDVNLFKDLEQLEDANDTLFYGEGWKMNHHLEEQLQAHFYNQHLVGKTGFFNDKFRDFVSGSFWKKEVGFAFGSSKNSNQIMHFLLGSKDYFTHPVKTINYVECHDNYTFYDFAKLYTNKSEEEVKDSAILAISIVLLSQGIPFIHMGQEFLRTKLGVENSYQSSDIINGIHYNLKDYNKEMIETFKDLIKIRKTYPHFKYQSHEEIYKNVSIVSISKYATYIFKYIHEVDELYLYIKNTYEEEIFTFDERRYIFNGRNLVDNKVCKVMINKPGIYLLTKGRW